jgi:hypothetical protein
VQARAPTVIANSRLALEAGWAGRNGRSRVVRLNNQRSDRVPGIVVATNVGIIDFKIDALNFALSV